MIDLDAPAIYEKMIQETEHEQVKLVINTFRGVEYISIRKYYLDFDEEFKPSNQGITIPMSSRDSLFSRIESNHRRKFQRFIG